MQDLASGSYYGGRRPEDGRIDWNWDAWRIHNLVRAVAPPYPGAHSRVGGRTLEILRTYYREDDRGESSAPELRAASGMLRLTCTDGMMLTVVDARLDGMALTPENFTQITGADCLPLAQQ
jgi:methionyl-tRNA formyltransferase